MEEITLNEALYTVADLVLQFGYNTSFRNMESVYHGGLSALENAFWILKCSGCKINSNSSITVKNLLKFMEQMEEQK